MRIVNLHTSVKLFAKGHLIFLGISFILSSLWNTNVQILSSRLCFHLRVASVAQSRLRCFMEVCPRAGKLTNVCQWCSLQVLRIGGNGCTQTFIWPYKRVRVLSCQTNGWLSSPLLKSAWLCPPSFVFQQELALSGDAKHSSLDKGHSHPRSGLLRRPELERLQHLLKYYFSTKETPNSEFVLVSCCIFIMFAKFCTSRSAFSGSLCVLG